MEWKDKGLVFLDSFWIYYFRGECQDGVQNCNFLI